MPLSPPSALSDKPARPGQPAVTTGNGEGMVAWGRREGVGREVTQRRWLPQGVQGFCGESPVNPSSWPEAGGLALRERPHRPPAPSQPWPRLPQMPTPIRAGLRGLQLGVLHALVHCSPCARCTGRSPACHGASPKEQRLTETRTQTSRRKSVATTRK